MQQPNRPHISNYAEAQAIDVGWPLLTNVQTTNAYRYTATQLDLVTAGSTPGVSLAIENVTRSENELVFECAAAVGQIMTLQTTTTAQPGSWQNVYTTNSPSTRIRFAVPVSSQAGASLYRLKNGS